MGLHREGDRIVPTLHQGSGRDALNCVTDHWDEQADDQRQHREPEHGLVAAIGAHGRILSNGSAAFLHCADLRLPGMVRGCRRVIGRITTDDSIESLGDCAGVLGFGKIRFLQPAQKNPRSVGADRGFADPPCFGLPQDSQIDRLLECGY